MKLRTLVILMLVGAVAAAAQTGSLRGMVSDVDGAAVVGEGGAQGRQDPTDELLTHDGVSSGSGNSIGDRLPT